MRAVVVSEVGTDRSSVRRANLGCSQSFGLALGLHLLHISSGPDDDDNNDDAAAAASAVVQNMSSCMS
jgi:hypothetical protein